MSIQLSAMPILPIQFKLINIHGNLAVAVYIYFFSPGSLRMHTDLRILNPQEFEDVFGESALPLANTRKWMQMTEFPFPGYCRAPGSSKCLPRLCNCDNLNVIWERFKLQKITKDKTFIKNLIKNFSNSTQ